MSPRRVDHPGYWGKKRYYSRRLAALFVVVAIVFLPLESAFAQNAGTSGTTQNSGAQDENNLTVASSPSNSDTNTTDTGSGNPPTQPSGSSPASGSTGSAGSPSTGSTGQSTGSNNSSNSSSQTTQTNNAAQSTPPPPPASPPSGSAAPDIQPVVYTSFNQNQLKVDQNTGALDTTFPLDIPPGRNNLQPTLTLVYNSQNTQQGSIFGEGWSASIPYIARLNKSGVDQLYSTSTLNYFTSSLDGELVSTTTVTSTGASYVARTDNGTFNKYTFSSSTDSWTMIDKNGTQYVFGSTSSSQESDPNNSANVYKWMLQQVMDTNGNSVLYNYFKDSGQIYPSSTIYTNTSSTTGIFEVDFQRTASTDNATSSATGFAVNSNYRVSEIDVKVNGTWVRKYVLGYSPGNNGNTALLSSIAESGENASGTIVALPSSTFSYQTEISGWVSSSTWDPPTPFVSSSSEEDGVEVANLTGDGLPGIITNSTAWVDTGNGWTTSSTWTSPVNFINGTGGDNGYRVVDLNNNGLDDIVSCNGSYINTGSGWQSSSTWNSPVCFANNGLSTGAILADVNGDGLPDIIEGSASGTPTYAAWINTGSGWATSTVWAPPAAFVSAGGLDTGTRIADVNGDGLPDILSGYDDASGTAHYGAWINTGDGWATSTLWTPPIVFMSNGGWDNGVRFTDLTGDGLADIVSGYTDLSGNPHYASYLDTGIGWATSTLWNPPALFDTDGGYDAGTRVVDVQGSGLPDIIQSYTDFQGTNHYLAWTNNNPSRVDLLTTINYPQGGSSAITYQAAAQSGNASGTIVNYAPYPVYVVSSITTNDDFGNYSTSTYQYSGGTYYYGSPTDHEFAGFSEVTQTDGAGNVTKTYYDTSNGSSTSIGQYQDNFWKIGKPFRVENYDNAGDLYKVTITKWDDASLGGNAAFVFPDQTVELDYDGLSTHEDKAESYTYSSSTGNQTQKIQWGQVTGNNNGTFTDTGTDEYITNNTYASSSTSNVIGKLSDEIILNQSSTKIQETQYYYDGLSLGSVGAGNLTEQSNWISGTTYANTENSYNGYGLVTQTLDPRNNTTTFIYDTYNLYVATTTNPLGQTTNNQYDYSTGKTTQTIDPNHLIFQTSYDGLGRPLQVLQPDQVTTSTLDIKTAYTYTDTSGAVSVEESDYLTATTTVNTYTYYDGLDRLIQTRKSATDAGEYKVTDQSYNKINLLADVSLPYFASSSAKSAATTTAALFTTYTYDPLGRVLDATNAVGTISNVYDNWKATITDANGNLKDEYNDAYGNLVEVGEHNGSSTYLTYYTYDGLKDLTNLTDANGNLRAFTFDGLGRMVSSTDLHASTDSTYGVWNYTYDAAGNLTSRVDPKSQTVNYTYDGLNRVLTETFTGASGTAVAYTYDTCTNGVGRLCTVSSTDAVSLITKTYDPLGNLASETETINGTNYVTSYTYDRQGDQMTVTNPDNSVIQYSYGTGGLVTAIQEKEAGGSWNYVVSSIDYSPMDKITTQTDPNGISTTNTYDPTRLYRLLSTVTTDTGSGFTPLSGGGNNNGNGNSGGPGHLPPTGGGTTYSCTSTLQTYIVPTGVTQLLINAYGAQGGGGGGGTGGEVAGTLSVTSGTTYYVDVGCQNGYNGGSNGGGGGNYPAYQGGGMTWFSASNIFTTSTVLMVAGGGGGQAGGYVTMGPNGGAGGGTSSQGGITQSGELNGGGGGAASQVLGGYGGYTPGDGGCTGSPGWVGTGGGGGCGGWDEAGAGGGGGGGYYGGGGGGGGAGEGGNNSGVGGGGGGGTSYLATTGSLTNTSNISGVNSGDGYLTITTLGSLSISSPNQYLLNSTTTLAEGSTTTQGGVTFGATMNDSASTTLQLQIEVEPAGTSFVGIPNVTSSFVSAGSVATTTFTWGYGSYHWQARAIDTNNNSSTWQLFGPSSTSTDFTMVAATTVTEMYTGSVASWTVPSNVTSFVITAVGAGGAAGTQDSGGGGGSAIGTFTTSTFTPGTTTYYFNVGGTNGYNNGGSSGGYGSANGGGMTWFSSTSTYTSSSALLVAAGGGGGGGFLGDAPGGNGGAGGGASGSPGQGSSGGGGGGGTQSSGGSGGNSASFCAGGGGGGGGYYGGGGGGGEGNGGNGSLGQGGAGGGGSNNDNCGGGGGGGGSSYASNLLTTTSTASTTNTGNGYITISETLQPAPLYPLNQYLVNGVTPLGEGSTTSQGTVVFGATLNATSSATTTLQLQVEVEPAYTSFTNSPNVTSSAFITPGNIATTSFTGLDATYHWQARWMDTHSNTSPWQLFGLMPNATDFTFVTSVVESYTGSVGSYTVPPHMLGLQITGDGAGGIAGGTTAESPGGGPGGGSQVTGYLPTTSGTYYYYVGGQSGVGGGGSAGPGGSGSVNGLPGGQGGDSTWISTQNTFDASHTIIVAGGGAGGGAGGYSNSRNGGYGGNGDYPSGDTGGTGLNGGGTGGSGGTTTTNAGGGGGGYSGGAGGTGTDQSGAGGGGGGGNSGGGSNGGGGGGGGASSFSSIVGLTSTSTTAGANSGNGSLTITEIEDVVPRLFSPNQYQANGITPLNEGSSTSQATVVFGGTVNSYFAPKLQLQVEVEPAGTNFTNTPNVTSSFVTAGSVATTSFTGANGSYHWQVRAIDTVNNTSSWQLFGPSPTSTDFTIAYPDVYFTFPTNGTSTANFPNWEMQAQNVTSSQAYQFQVLWDDTTGDPVQSSTVNATGSVLLSGLNIPKTVFSGDYTYDGTPVTMNATGTLSSASTTVATTTVSYTELTTTVPLNCGSSQIQCISYQYDNNGNITKIVDDSATNAAKTVAYTYDSLNRLLTASSSNVASGQNYLQTFSYDPVGNILSGPDGTYAYAGTNYTDPDAATSITNGSSTTTFIYDDDGNLTNASSGFHYTWDYNNRLISATSSNASLSYGYDYLGNRVTLTQGSTTTVYPTSFYSVGLGGAATTTKSVFADGILMGTVLDATTTTGGGPGTITLDTSSTRAISGVTVTTATSTITTGSGSNEFLVISIANGSLSATTTGVSVDGVSATQAVVGRNGVRNSSIWYVKGLSAGTHAISSTYSASQQVSIAATSFFGINQTTPLDVTSTQIATSTNVSSTLTTSASGDLIIDALDSPVTQTSTAAGSNQTYVMKNLGETSNMGNAGYQIASGSGANTESYTMSTSTGFTFAVAAFKAATLSTSTATSSVTEFVSNDLFKGSNVATSASGTLAETLDYYPYGGIRLDNTTSTAQPEIRKYIDQPFDSTTNLNYFSSRYQDPNRGQFLSEDPMFLGNPAQQNLSEPESLNSYSYADDNPIAHFDPNGKDQFTDSNPILSQDIDAGIDLDFFTPETVDEGIDETVVQDSGEADGSLADIPSLISELSGGFEDETTNAFPIEPPTGLQEGTEQIEQARLNEPIYNGEGGDATMKPTNAYKGARIPIIVGTIGLGGLYALYKGSLDIENTNVQAIYNQNNSYNPTKASGVGSVQAYSPGTYYGGASNESTLSQLYSLLNQLQQELQELQNNLSDHNNNDQ